MTKRKSRKKSKEDTTTKQEKTITVWSNEDEIAIMKAYLKCKKKGLRFLDNVHKVIESAQGSTSQTATRRQMSEKKRRLRMKYETTLENMKKQPDFQFKDTHQEKMFQLWKRAWPELNPEEEQQPALEGSPMEVEQEHPVLAGNPVVIPRDIDSTNASCSAIDSEFTAMMTDTFTNVITMLKNYDAQTTAMVENVLKSTTTCASPVWGGNLLKRTNEPPLLDARTTQMLKEKWDHQHKRELEIFSERLTLLTEEYMMGLEELNKGETDTGN